MKQTAFRKMANSLKLAARNTVAIFLLSLATVSNSTAEEGMLIPSLISAFENEMQAFGMKLTAEEIYSVNNSSLKDAILHFGGGCTAELVSGQGLLLTNHHCGFSQIQSHSSVERDYLKNGFWAKNKSEELKNPGLTAARVVEIRDVSEGVFFGTEGLSGQALSAKIKKNISEIVAEALRNNEYSAKISAFNQGNDYYMVIKETFTDVRLVGAPPSSIGKFGGDTDNWVWPRHTGDFSVFRIYANSDNKPSAVSDSNVPYKPLHFLPASLKKRIDGWKMSSHCTITVMKMCTSI
ncbi:MAG: S46 family peptidase [Crocinitomicaceae bacterium]|nr:S46 family peptidase [Crocinitomicaceae bacterium]